MSFKKISIKTAAIISVCLGIAGQVSHASELATIKPGVLTVGSDMTWAPFEYLENGVPAGIDIELMKKISEGLSLKPDFRDTRFASLVPGLAAKRFDVVASALYVTPERAKYIDYVPYLKTGGALVTSKDNTYQPKTIEDMCGRKVAALKGAAWIQTLKNLSSSYCVPQGKGEMVIQEYDSTPMAVQALFSRAAEVQFDDAAVLNMMVKKMPTRLQITSTEILYPVVVGLGVRKGDAAMKEALEAQLQRLRNNGEYAALLKQYGLSEPSKEEIAAAYIAK
jgi:polar amino acid transport system substrate-binding protein